MNTKFFSIITLVLMLCIGQSKAQEWKDARWTNGWEVVVAEQIAPSQVLLVASSYGDAGYGYLFNVKKTGAESYDMIGTDKPLAVPADKDGIAYAIINGHNYNGNGIRWKRTSANGFDLLLRYDEGKLTSIYTEQFSDMREYTQRKIMEAIEGDYSDATGKAYRFMSDGQCVFAGETTTYTVENEFDAPGFIVKVNEEKYVLDLNREGMLIYEALPDVGEGGFRRGNFIAALNIECYSYRWSTTSSYTCSSYVLELLDADVLRLMRNEIYARYGWNFKDPKLNSYFKQFRWYKPAKDNTKIKLTATEKLNVDLITYYENRAAR